MSTELSQEIAQLRENLKGLEAISGTKAAADAIRQLIAEKEDLLAGQALAEKKQATLAQVNEIGKKLQELPNDANSLGVLQSALAVLAEIDAQLSGNRPVVTQNRAAASPRPAGKDQTAAAEDPPPAPKDWRSEKRYSLEEKFEIIKRFKTEGNRLGYDVPDGQKQLWANRAHRFYKMTLPLNEKYNAWVRTIWNWNKEKLVAWHEGRANLPKVQKDEQPAAPPVAKPVEASVKPAIITHEEMLAAILEWHQSPEVRGGRQKILAAGGIPKTQLPVYSRMANGGVRPKPATIEKFYQAIFGPPQVAMAAPKPVAETAIVATIVAKAVPKLDDTPWSPPVKKPSPRDLVGVLEAHRPRPRKVSLYERYENIRFDKESRHMVQIAICRLAEKLGQAELESKFLAKFGGMEKDKTHRLNVILFPLGLFKSEGKQPNPGNLVYTYDKNKELFASCVEWLHGLYDQTFPGEKFWQHADALNPEISVVGYAADRNVFGFSKPKAEQTPQPVNGTGHTPPAKLEETPEQIAARKIQEQAQNALQTIVAQQIPLEGIFGLVNLDPKSIFEELQKPTSSTTISDIATAVNLYAETLKTSPDEAKQFAQAGSEDVFKQLFPGLEFVPRQAAGMDKANFAYALGQMRGQEPTYLVRLDGSKARSGGVFALRRLTCDMVLKEGGDQISVQGNSYLSYPLSGDTKFTLITPRLMQEFGIRNQEDFDSLVPR